MSVGPLAIKGMGHRGDGVADGPEGAIYVPFALPGETVEIESTNRPDRARLIRVEQASPDRVAPFCPHFGVCGGCATQHWAEGPYRDWKRGLVVAALAAAGLDAPVGELVDAHGEGRRRVVLHARRGGRGVLTVGFAAQRSHEIVPIDRCPVSVPALAAMIPAATDIADALAGVGKPLDIAITATDTGLDVDVRGSGPLDARATSALAGIAGRHRLARLTRHGEIVAQSTPPQITMGRAIVELPPGAFLQATAHGEEVLTGLAITAVGKARHIADLFAGVGPFALRLAETAAVTAIDSEAPAMAALARAVARVQGLKPVRTDTRDLFRRPLVAAELASFDAVVFDPPRQGAEAQARALAASKVPIVVGVSCNPATFVRDAALIVAGGYRLEAVTPVDQFRHTAHVELVGVFRR